MTSTRAVSASVRGRVQGVFYRASLASEARSLGVSGWVRNLSDGSVGFWVQGSEEGVRALLAWAEHGPPHARVDELVVRDVNPEPALAGFEIRR